MSKLVLFDFDGTITKKDSLLSFVRFTNGLPTLCLGLVLLSPALALYFVKIIPNWRMKEMLMRYFWFGRTEEYFQKNGDKFCDVILSKILRPAAVAKINWYKENNWKVVIVTASAKYWIEKWAKKHDITLICTELELVQSQITGKIKGKNCYGVEKVNRINEVIKLSEYDEIHAYGDSRGDREMLKLASQAYYRPFKL